MVPVASEGPVCTQLPAKTGVPNSVGTDSCFVKEPGYDHQENRKRIQQKNQF